MTEKRSYYLDYDETWLYFAGENPLRRVVDRPDSIRERREVMVPDTRGQQIELTEEDFADYQRVTAEFDAWQKRLAEADSA